MGAQIENNMNPTYCVIRIGVDKTPCIIFDDFTNDLEWLINEAKRSCFKKVLKKSYPGIRDSLPKNYTAKAVDHLHDVIRAVYEVPDDFELAGYSGYFSLITKTESELSVPQKMPHFDTAEPYYFAVLHYLNDGQHGGTGFFRHKPSGIERVSFECVDLYMTRVKQYIAGNGLPAGGYCLGDDHFELTDRVDYVKNRLIVYPGNILHSGLIDQRLDVDSDVETGRLTANIFLGFDKC
jgi:hypothetical protein